MAIKEPVRKVFITKLRGEDVLVLKRQKGDERTRKEVMIGFALR